MFFFEFGIVFCQCGQYVTQKGKRCQYRCDQFVVAGDIFRGTQLCIECFPVDLRVYQPERDVVLFAAGIRRRNSADPALYTLYLFVCGLIGEGGGNLMGFFLVAHPARI